MPRHPVFALLAPTLCIFSILTVVGCAGCGGGGDADAGPGPAVEIGTGTIDWVPLTADQDLELIAGPQGGHHFIVHARMQGISPGDPERPGIPDNPATLFQVFDEDGEQVDAQFPPNRLGYQAIGNGWFVLPSGRILQLIEGEVERLFDERVRIVVRVGDEHGREAMDEAWVIAVREEGAPDAGVGLDAATPDAQAARDTVDR